MLGELKPKGPETGVRGNAVPAAVPGVPRGLAFRECGPDLERAHHGPYPGKPIFFSLTSNKFTTQMF